MTITVVSIRIDGDELVKTMKDDSGGFDAFYEIREEYIPPTVQEPTEDILSAILQDLASIKEALSIIGGE